MKKSIYSFTFEQLTDWIVKNGERKYRAEQIWDWLYRKRVKQFSHMKNLNQSCLDLLEEHLSFGTMEEELRQESADGTIKFLFKLADGHLIETVLMNFHYGMSICVTTQVGCNIGCSFCASGLLPKTRDLTSGEIVEQIVKTQQLLDERGEKDRVSHVVVMGIGEPLDNYDNLCDFLHTINHDKGLAIGARHITVSTSGLVHKIYDFTDFDLQVNLAVSLHAPNDELRTRMMKINRAFPIEKLMKAIDYYLEKRNRRITFEYILIEGLNDQVEHAHELAKLLEDKKHLSYVNLIPYNPVNEHIHYERSSEEHISGFFQTLKQYGIQCGVRREQGADIDAACGQLRSRQMNQKKAKSKS